MSHSSSERRRGPNALYMEKVRYLQERLQDEENVEKVIAGFDKVGKFYFGADKYRSSSDEYEGGDEIPMHTHSEFKEKYTEEMGEDDEELLDRLGASFSDAYRHAVLVNVKTLKVAPLTADGPMPKQWKGIPSVPSSDHILLWDTVQALPLLLAKSDFVVLHGDTEDSLAFFFPVPSETERKSSSRKSSSTRKNSSSNRKSSNRKNSTRKGSNRSH